MKKWSITILFFVLLTALWQAAVYSEKWSPILLPAPLDVVDYFLNEIEDGVLIEASLITLRRLVVGYIIGLVLGIPLGLLNARFAIFEYTFGTVALGLQILPSICWAPLAILWFGQTEAAMLFIVIMGSLWSIAIATDNGARQVPPIYLRAARTLGSKGLHTWFKVILPAAFPSILSGMKQGWAFAWRSLMAAEIYITIITGFGLGNLLHNNRELLAMDGVVAVMFVIAFIGLSAHKLIFSPIEKYLFSRWGVNKLN